MLRVKGLDHVGLRVSDMERTLRFYRDQLGLTLLRESGPDATGTRSAVIRVGGQELNVFQHPGLGPAEDRSRVGMDHLCLAMEAASVDDLIADLAAAGLTVVRGPVQRRDGVSVFLSDPDGIRVELRLPS